jgi:hypothetical protein
MTRTRALVRCPDCNEVPNENDEGTLKCRCPNVRWEYRKGVPGTAEEELLTSNGFQRTEDCRGDVYYVPDIGPIIHLYRNNEWECDPVPDDCGSLEAYLAWRRKKLDQAF